jgi:DNA-directed RNA polymerase specialized sigma24 family protein
MAAMLGVPVGTLKWRISEARRIVREKLQRLGY